MEPIVRKKHVKAEALQYQKEDKNKIASNEEKDITHEIKGINKY
jgi:hypothetical protein